MSTSVPPEFEPLLGKSLRTLAFWAILVVGTIWLVQYASDRRRNIVDISYNELVKEVDRGNVAAVQVTAGRRVRGDFRTPVTVAGRSSSEFQAFLPFESSDSWVAALMEKGVDVRGGEEKQSFGVVLLTFLPYLLIFFVVIVMLRQMQARRRQDGR